MSALAFSDNGTLYAGVWPYTAPVSAFSHSCPFRLCVASCFTLQFLVVRDRAHCARAESSVLNDLLLAGGVIALVLLGLLSFLFIYWRVRPPQHRLLVAFRTRAPTYVNLISVLFLSSLSTNLARLYFAALVRSVLFWR